MLSLVSVLLGAALVLLLVRENLWRERVESLDPIRASTRGTSLSYGRAGTIVSVDQQSRSIVFRAQPILTGGASSETYLLSIPAGASIIKRSSLREEGLVVGVEDSEELPFEALLPGAFANISFQQRAQGSPFAASQIIIGDPSTGL